MQKAAGMRHKIFIILSGEVIHTEYPRNKTAIKTNQNQDQNQNQTMTGENSTTAKRNQEEKGMSYKTFKLVNNKQHVALSD